MADSDLHDNLEKAIAFFERAEEVAATDNFDYAIDMYIEGLRKSPDAVEDGHIPLRRLSLIRQGKGGKKPTLADKVKRHGGKRPVDEMLNAEFMLAKDPDNLTYASNMLKAALAGQFHRTAQWIAHLVFEANKASNKPSFQLFVLLKDAYQELKLYDLAVSACGFAVDLKPNDDALREELKQLSAHMTMQRGKYGENGSFTQSIKNKDLQQKLQNQDKFVKSPEYKLNAVNEARKAYESSPASEVAIINLAKALTDLETEESIKEAQKLLNDAYQKTGAFIYKRTEGEIRIRQLKYQIRDLKDAVKKNPTNESLKKQHNAMVFSFAKTELEHFKQCVQNYPTDLKMKYEYGLRLIINKEYDKAIPLLQEAQKDPRQRVSSLDKIGLCFFLKGWYSDAIDVFTQAFNECQVKDSPLAKEIRYNLARSFESDNKPDKAVDEYRKLVQIDFSFKDVSQRLEKLRKKL